MGTPPAKKDPVPELAELPRPRSAKDLLTLVVVGVVGLPVLLFVLVIGLAYGNPRIVGPPHWSDKVFRAFALAWQVALLAVFCFLMWREFWPK